MIRFLQNLHLLFTLFCTSLEILHLTGLKVLIVLLMLLVFPAEAETICSCLQTQLSSRKNIKYSSDGDFIVGGIFNINDLYVYENIHFNKEQKREICRLTSVKQYRHLLVFIYTLGEINKDHRILPNITLGYQIHDSCGTGHWSLVSTFSILSGVEQMIPNYNCRNHENVVGFIGDLSSVSSLCIAQLIGPYGYPQISYGTSDPIFNNKLEFPTFYRTIPNQLSEIDGITRLLNHFGWKWIGLIVSDGEVGQQASEKLEKSIHKHGICLAFFIRLHLMTLLPEYSKNIINTISKSTANVIVLFVTSEYAEYFDDFFGWKKMPKKIWIASPSFFHVIQRRFLELKTTFNGTLALSTQEGDIPGFKQFFYSLNPTKYPKDLSFTFIWEMIFKCSFTDMKLGLPNLEDLVSPKCTGNESLFEADLSSIEIFNFRISYQVYTAVYAMAHALHKMYLKQKTREKTKINFKYWQLNTLLHNVAFRTSSGDDIYFTGNRDPPARYDILKCFFSKEEDLRTIKVGSFDVTKPASKQFYINDTDDLWGPYFSKFPHSQCNKPCRPGFRKTKIEKEPVCCYNCTQCAEGEMSNATDSETCIKCPEHEKSNIERNGCIPKKIDFLSYEDTLGATLFVIALIFSFICAVILVVFIKYNDTPIVKASNRNLSCLLLISLMLCFLCTLLFIGHPTQICCLLQQVTFGFIFTISVSLVLAKTLTVIIAFNATKPGSRLKKYVGSQLSIVLVIVCSLGEIVISVVWTVSSPPFPEADTLTDQDTIIMLCNEGSTSFFFCIIGYIGTLALLSFIAAFLAKDFPDRFNEAKNITFSMLVFCSVWVAFVPAYLSSKGSRMVAVEIFAILSSSAGLLGCIFIPKCYIIFLKPKVNTRQTFVIRLQNNFVT